MSRDWEGLCSCVSCGRVDDFKLTIGSFPLKRWKEGGSDEWVDGFVGCLGIRGDGLANGGPHAASTSRADRDVGVSVLRSENEKWVDRFVVNV